MSDEDRVLAYIQGRMSPDEEARLEAAMADDADLRAEVAAFTAVRHSMASDVATPDENGWARLSEAIGGDQVPAANDNRPVRLSLLQAACVAIAAVICWQAIVTVLPGSDTSYQPASVADGLPSLQVAFAPSASVADVSALLSELEGVIVDGPSALGLYTLSFPDAAAQEAALSALQGRPDVAEEVIKPN